MVKRFLVAVTCILAMPMCLSLHKSGTASIATSFAPVALAGRSIAGGYYCTCGCPDCICDPGESQSQCKSGNSVTANPVSDDAPAPITDPTGAPDLDFSSGALLVVIGFMLWTRFRA